MKSLPRMLRWLGAGLLVLGVIAGSGGVAVTAGHELDARSDWRNLGELVREGTPPLVTAELAQGQRMVFELCADDGFVDPAWGAVEAEVLGREEGELRVARATPLHELASRVNRRAQGPGCVVIADAPTLGDSGELGVGVGGGEAVLRALSAREVRANIVARMPIGRSARLAVFAVFVGSVLLLAGFGATPVRALEKSHERGARHDLGRVGVALGGLALPLFLAGPLLAGLGVTLSLRGALVGLLVAATEVGLAWRLTRSPDAKADADADADAALEVAGGSDPMSESTRVLGLARPERRAGLLFALAPFLGVLLWIGGRVALQTVPSTGPAPIETFVALPSGALALALIGNLAPFVEELFFRGLVYGLAERAFASRGPATAGNLAALVSIAAFAAIHLPQQWGAWGAVLSVIALGIVTTLLRRFTRSILPGVGVHIAHNALITLRAIA